MRTRRMDVAAAGAMLVLAGCAAGCAAGGAGVTTTGVIATGAPAVPVAARAVPVTVPWRDLPPAAGDVPIPSVVVSTGGPPLDCPGGATGSGTLVPSADGSLSGRLHISVAPDGICTLPAYPTVRILDRVGHVLATGTGPATETVEPPARFGWTVSRAYPAGLTVTVRGLGCARPAFAEIPASTATVRLALTSPPATAGCGRPDHATLTTGPMGATARSAPDPPASRAGLRLVLDAPATAAAGTQVRLLLRVTNPTGQAIPLAPCPDVALGLGSHGSGGGAFFALNCTQAPATVPAGSEVDFVIVHKLKARGRTLLTLGIAGTQVATTTIALR